VRFKICGIVSERDAALTIEHGAAALGFLVGLDYDSNDAITAAAASTIIAGLPPFISSVLVTHQADAGWIVRTAREMRCTTVQLHGDFALDKIPYLRAELPNVSLSRVVHVMDDSAIAFAKKVANAGVAIHLDSRSGSRLGGTGKVHDWSISARIVQAVNVPVVLAGGLNADNVRAAIETVKPYAVDVNSGVDMPDGPHKSPERLQAFAKAVASVTSG
jgi:phosphoribosylanthranilate isomerase